MRRARSRGSAAAAVGVLLLGSCALRQGQRYSDFITPAPLGPPEYLVLGFLGGWEPWDNDERWVRKLALKLRAQNLPGVHVETLANSKRKLALELIENVYDRDRDGSLDAAERDEVRLILYGHSFGGAAVVKLARRLQSREIPVLLTVQIDSVGLNDGEIPANVRAAANLHQPNGWFIKGETPIRAEDPAKTEILGNIAYDYSDKTVDLSHVGWFKKLFRSAHTKIGNDPDVWAKVEELILDAIEADRARSRRSTEAVKQS